MKALITEDCILHIIPESSTEVVALKYWVKEFGIHGVKMIEVADTLAEGKEIMLEHGYHHH